MGVEVKWYSSMFVYVFVLSFYILYFFLCQQSLIESLLFLHFYCNIYNSIKLPFLPMVSTSFLTL